MWGGTAGGGAPATIPNNVCVTDADIQREVKSLIVNDGLISHVQSGHTPLVTVMTPPGVEVCLDAAGDLCSANAGDNPPPPTVTTAPTGGSIPAGTYQVVVTYQTGSETLPSAPVTITTTGSSSTLTIASPPAQTGATAWYAYVSDGSGYHRQGSAEPIGDDAAGELIHCRSDAAHHAGRVLLIPQPGHRPADGYPGELRGAAVDRLHDLRRA